MIHFITGILLFYCASTYAFETCMSQCSESGIEVIVETSCAAPGGPVTRTTQYFNDECSENQLKDYSCVGSSAGDHVMTEVHRCKVCSDDREGVCLERF